MVTPAKLHLSGFWLSNYSGRLTGARRNSWNLDRQGLRKLEHKQYKNKVKRTAVMNTLLVESEPLGPSEIALYTYTQNIVYDYCFCCQ